MKFITPQVFSFHVYIKITHNQIFSYFSITLLRDIVNSSKNTERLLDSGGLYIPKHIHFLLITINSEHKHSLHLGSESLNV